MDYLTIALILIVIGVVLLIAEILVPTGGLLVVGALLFFAIGVGTILYNGDTVEAVVALAGLGIGLPAAGFVAVAAYRRMSLRSALDSDEFAATAIDVPQLAGLEALKGRIGKALSPLRPSGAVEFDGRRVDAMTEGMMIDAGVWVRCVDIRAGTAVVREMDAPRDIADIQLDEELPPPSSRRPIDDFDLGLER
jgi:membrane-bound ClpP family serine protease